MKEIEVIYEDGVFKPLEKVELSEGFKGRVALQEAKLERYYRSIPIKVSKKGINAYRLELLER